MPQGTKSGLFSSPYTGRLPQQVVSDGEELRAAIDAEPFFPYGRQQVPRRQLTEAREAAAKKKT
jgi:hypothetical protein